MDFRSYYEDDETGSKREELKSMMENKLYPPRFQYQVETDSTATKNHIGKIIKLNYRILGGVNESNDQKISHYILIGKWLIMCLCRVVICL